MKLKPTELFEVAVYEGRRIYLATQNGVIPCKVLLGPSENGGFEYHLLAGAVIYPLSANTAIGNMPQGEYFDNASEAIKSVRAQVIAYVSRMNATILADYPIHIAGEVDIA